MQLLRQEVLEKLKQNINARSILGYNLNVHPDTIRRWVHNNSPMLTTVTALETISKELNIKKSEILA